MIPLSNQHIKNAEHNFRYVTVLCHFSQVVLRHYKGVTPQNLKIVPSFGVSCLNLMRKLRQKKKQLDFSEKVRKKGHQNLVNFNGTIISRGSIAFET